MCIGKINDSSLIVRLLDDNNISSKMSNLNDWTQFLFEQSIRSSTYSSYKSSWNIYLKFCNEYDVSPLPVTQSKMTYFIAKRAKKVKPRTIDKDFYAIKHNALLNGQNIDQKQWKIFNQVRIGIKKVIGNNVDKRRPTTWVQTRKILSILNLNDYDTLVLACNIALASLGGLRKSEAFAANKLVKCNKKALSSVKALYIRNLDVKLNFLKNDIDYFDILIKNSKTDLQKEDFHVYLGKGIFPLCFKTLMSKMLILRDKMWNSGNNNLSMNYNDPLFCLKDGSILTDGEVFDTLPYLFKKAGLDFTNITNNTWRFGCATSLGRRKVSSYLIKIFCRWKSDSYQTYIRFDPSETANILHSIMKKPVISQEVFEFQSDFNI